MLSKIDDLEINKRITEDVFALWQKFPLTIITNSSNIEPECKSAYNDFIRGVKANEFNALKMLDASAKLPSGLLRGNVNQYGDFDECLEVDSAQYCLADIDLQPIWKEPFVKFKNLVHSHFAIKETFEDPGHRVPGFTFVRWGFCIPKQCSSKDLEKSIEASLGVRARIRPSMCQLRKEDNIPLTFGDFIARFLLGSILLAVVISTFISLRQSEGVKSGKLYRILMTFSIQKNWKQLFEIKQENSNEIRAVHGIRALSALALIISHKTMALLYNPYINRSVMSQNFGMKWSVIGRTAILYTDCFMLISGLLNANALFNDLEKTGSMKFKDKLIGRIFRISPNLIALILFCTYLLPSMSSGPLWPLVINHHSELCKKYMWRNILYVHNYYGFESMCLTHTHQVGIDMQLFLTTPIIVYLIWKMKDIGLWLMGIIAVASTVLRLWVSWVENLSHVVHFGIPISRMFDTANLSYILPTHRATIYLMGVYLAYILKFTNPKPAFSKFQQAVIWTLLMLLGFSAWLGPVHMSEIGYEYRKIDGALYGAFSPIFLGAPIAWVIYATMRDYGGWFGDLLSWKYFQVFTKISYAVYLIQFPVFFYNVGQTRHVDEYKSSLMLQFTETCIILLLSTFLTLAVEIPFLNIKKILFPTCNQMVKIQDVHKEPKNVSVQTQRFIGITTRKYKAG